MMQIYSVETGHFKLDGGAMFGVVPKSIWHKTNPSDVNNLIDIAATSLLIEDGNKLILIDTGLGDKQSDKFFGHYHRWGDHSIDLSLKKIGFHRDDITDVFLTHLHFDHCGGCIQWNKNKTAYETAFKNAIFWTNEDHWRWATQPNAREKASFLKENLLPMQDSGQLQFIKKPNQGNFKTKSELGFGILFVDGHTEKQMIPHILFQGKTLVFMADLLPTVGHIPTPYIMGYDTRPLISLEEKSEFMKTATKEEFYLFLEHDAHNKICTVKQTEKGFRLQKTYSFEDFIGN